MTRPAVTLHLGDCLDVLRQMPEASVDAVVTDPPYGLSFMGKRWDYDVPSVEVWAECLRVLKPGGHLLAFAGTRTQHRMAVRIEDAGFEIRDMIAWVYGSGFPKSLDVSKAIDKAAGAEREVVGQSTNGIAGGSGRHVGEEGAYGFSGSYAITAPATDAARQWAGWGTALKPALEPITVARKPLAGTVAETVLAYGTGAINVDGCRVGDGADKGDWPITQRRHADVAYTMGPVLTDKSSGRWPANLIHDGGPDVADLLGEAARFFYCAKASRADRDGGLEGFDLRSRPTMGSGIGGQPDQSRANNRNHHPTVKPTDLMRYLCRLVTQPGGVVLDPFMGSGSTGRGAVLEGFAFVGIEREADYLTIAQARIEAAQQEAQVERPQPSLFDQVAD
jgi:site-specific DNA-methyltransferase (adenine-specific)